MRILIATGLGAIVTASLLFLMHVLVSGSQVPERVSTRVDVDVFTRSRNEEQPRPETRPPPRELLTHEPKPSQPQIGATDQSEPLNPAVFADGPSISLPDAEGVVPTRGLWSSYEPAREGDLIPLSRPPPVFPPQARMDGTSGWVDVEIIVGPDGNVHDARIRESEPDTVFDRAALSAVWRWRFKPSVVDGEPVSRSARLRIDFVISDTQ